MSGMTVLVSSYRRASSTPDAPGSCKALRECVLSGFPDQGRTDRRAYGEVTGVFWLQTNCQPEGVFAKTMLLWNWPLVALPLYWPLMVTRLIATAVSPP